MTNIICLCNDLTDDQIEAVIKNGAASLDEVFAALGSDLYCGTCLGDIDHYLFPDDD